MKSYCKESLQILSPTHNKSRGVHHSHWLSMFLYDKGIFKDLFQENRLRRQKVQGLLYIMVKGSRSTLNGHRDYHRKAMFQ